MRKLLVLFVLLSSLAASAQSVLHRSYPGTPDKAPVTPISTVGAGNCPGTGCAYIRVENVATMFVSLTGTWVGTMQFSCSNDQWVTVKPVVAHAFTAGAVGTVGQTTTTTNGDFIFPTLGFRECGIYASTYTSGAPTLRLDADASTYFGTTGAAVSNVTPVPSTAGGASLFTNGAVTTVVQVKATAGQVYSIHTLNTTAAVAYLQLFCKPSASVTLGTTAPDAAIGLAASGIADVTLPVGACNAGTGLSVAGTTTATGAVGAALAVALSYQ